MRSPMCVINVGRHLTLKGPGGGGGGGGGGIRMFPPLDISRDNFFMSFHDFFLSSLATFGAIFGKIGRTVPKLRNTSTVGSHLCTKHMTQTHPLEVRSPKSRECDQCGKTL